MACELKKLAGGAWGNLDRPFVAKISRIEKKKSTVVSYNKDMFGILDLLRGRVGLSHIILQNVLHSRSQSLYYASIFNPRFCEF